MVPPQSGVGLTSRRQKRPRESVLTAVVGITQVEETIDRLTRTMESSIFLPPQKQPAQHHIEQHVESRVGPIMQPVARFLKSNGNGHGTEHH